MNRSIISVCVILILLVGCVHNNSNMIHKHDSSVEISDHIINEDTTSNIDISKERINLGKLTIDVNNDESIDNVYLYYEDSLTLEINDTKFDLEDSELDCGITNEGLKMNSEMYKLYYIKENHTIGICYNCPYFKEKRVYFGLYGYDDDSITNMWSSETIDVELTELRLDEQKVYSGFPFADIYHYIDLTDRESEESVSIINELKENGVKVDNNLLMEIKDNIVCNTRELIFEDYNNDGNKELMVLATIYTVGAKTPVSICEDVIFIMDVTSEHIQCTDIVINRETDSRESPFKYFT